MGKVYKKEKLLLNEGKYPQDIIRKHCLQKLEGRDCLGGPVIKTLRAWVPDLVREPDPTCCR